MKSRKIWKTVLIVLGCALGAWAFGALLLPVLLPFFIGLAVSLLAEKPVRFLQTRGHVPAPAGVRAVCTAAVRDFVWRTVFSVPPAVLGGGGSCPSAAAAGGKSDSAF